VPALKYPTRTSRVLARAMREWPSLARAIAVNDPALRITLAGGGKPVFISRNVAATKVSRSRP
jgi:hypothetical protein